MILNRRHQPQQGGKIKQKRLDKDLGAEKDSDWQWSNLEMIIDYQYRFKDITIVVTSLDITKLKRKSERILSRFSNQDISQLVLNKGSDYRRR